MINRLFPLVLILSVIVTLSEKSQGMACKQLFSQDPLLSSKPVDSSWPEDRALDFKYNANKVSVTDLMGTVQRINPWAAKWAICDGNLQTPLELQSQIRTDTSMAQREGKTSLSISSSEQEVQVTLGNVAKFQRTPGNLTIRMQQGITTQFSQGLSVKMTSADALEVKIIAKTESTMSDNRVTRFYPILFSTGFKRLPNSRTHSNTIDFTWREFTAETRQLSESDGFYIDQIYLVFRRPTRSEGEVRVEFEGPIFVMQNLGREHDFAEFLRIWNGLGSNSKVQRRFLASPLPSTFKEKILNGLFDRDNQAFARELQKQGRLQQEIESLQLNTMDVPEKMTQFFDFFKIIIDGKVPAERGEFGDYHGVHSHALQIAAMTRNLNAEERILFRDFYRELGHDSFFGWKIWTILFDGVDPSLPTSPRYWK